MSDTIVMTVVAIVALTLAAALELAHRHGDELERALDVPTAAEAE